jgi:hypothetical protein
MTTRGQTVSEPTAEQRRETHERHMQELQRQNAELQLANTRLGRSDTRLKIASGVVGVVAILVSTYFGVQAHQSNQDATQSSQSVQAQQTENSAARVSASQTIDALNAQVSSLQSENAALSSSLAVTPTAVTNISTSALPTPLPTTTGQVRHTDPFDLVQSGNSPDLDTPAGDPQWGASDNSGFTADFYPASGHPPGLNPALPGVKFVILPATAPSYDACHKATGYANIVLETKEVNVGDLICVFTTEGRFAAMSVTYRDENKLSFQITTYQK